MTVWSQQVDVLRDVKLKGEIPWFFSFEAVDAFSEDRISPNILKQLLKREDVVTEIKTKDAEKESLILYEKGKVVDYFIMIIHGNVEVNVGMESFTFNQGEKLIGEARKWNMKFSLRSM